MSKIVVAGSADCPHLARVELLADKLSKNLPNFSVHKIIKQPFEWQGWIDEICAENGWDCTKSPVVWRELVHRGGKGVLIGGANEFQEYAASYYGVESEKLSSDMKNMAVDNVKFKEADDLEDRYLRSMSNPMKICITNASSVTAYHLIPQIAKGEIIGNNCEISLILYSENKYLHKLKGIQLETFDLAYPLLRTISITDDLEAALDGSSLVVVLDELESSEEDTKDEWIKRNVAHFHQLGSLIEHYCSADAKVLVAPAREIVTKYVIPLNMNLQALKITITRLQKYNIVGMVRGFERQIKAVLAEKLEVNSSRIYDVIVWGNLGGKKAIDFSRTRISTYQGSITGPESFTLLADTVIWEKKWLRTKIEPEIEKRLADLNSKRSTLGAAGLASAHNVASLLKDWFRGSQTQQIYSLLVDSEGFYGVPNDYIFSLPVRFHPPGYWTIVQDVDFSDSMQKSINDCIKDVEKIYLKLFTDESESQEVLDNAIYDAVVRLYPVAEADQINGMLRMYCTTSDIRLSLFGAIENEAEFKSQINNIQKVKEDTESKDITETTNVKTNENTDGNVDITDEIPNTDPANDKEISQIEQDEDIENDVTEENPELAGENNANENDPEDNES